MRVLHGLMVMFCVAAFSGCTGGDFDLGKIFEIDPVITTPGDGNLTYYRDPQIISPVPPSPIVDSDNVEIGFIIHFTPGPSATVPTRIEYTIAGLTDASLPTRLGQADLVYVPAPPPGPIAAGAWCVFNPGTCAALFTDLPGGDYYYAIVIENMGPLPAGTHDFQIVIDPNDIASPEDDIQAIKYRTLQINVASTLLAPVGVAKLDK